MSSTIKDFIKLSLIEKTPVNIQKVAGVDQDLFGLQTTDIDPVESKKDINLANKLEKLNSYVRQKHATMGCGSSRCVYALKSKKALKLATEPSGLAQNKTEVDFYNSHAGLQKHLTKVFDYDKKNYVWIISELVKPLEEENPASEKQWKELTGFDSANLAYCAPKLMALKVKPENVLKALISELQYMFVKPENLAMAKTKAETQFPLILKFIAEVIEPLDAAGLSVDDLTQRLDNWGVTADRRLVVLDTGLTSEVHTAFYKPGK